MINMRVKVAWKQVTGKIPTEPEWDGTCPWLERRWEQALLWTAHPQQRIEDVMTKKKGQPVDWESLLSRIARGRMHIECGADRNIFRQGPPADSSVSSWTTSRDAGARSLSLLIEVLIPHNRDAHQRGMSLSSLRLPQLTPVMPLLHPRHLVTHRHCSLPIGGCAILTNRMSNMERTSGSVRRYDCR